ncbi:MAG TPA: phosphoribosylformylglycinamidine synthase subunit PurS [Longimicrobiales bacterium]|nr:phosphoribosylformylglycinamidine synthase subunit PurS [Longimicrobiales bacterium]
MKDYKLEVHITPREGLLDPEGKAVEHALQALAFEGVSSVRVGRLVTLNVSAASDAAARARAEEMCRKLLANPVTEDFSIALAEA